MNVLAGRRALVTGGSRGIGAAIVKRLAADGAMVGFTYAASATAADTLRAEVSERGGTAVAIQADSADAQQVTDAVDATVAAFGGLDILVNNAGLSKSGVAESFALQDFDRMLAVNVRGVFVAIQRAIPHLGAGGRIVTTGSIFADRVPRPGSAVYAMTKAALSGLTRGLARELGPRGITVNVIQPGPTATDANPDAGEFADAMRELTAVGHYGRPEDIASAVAYLVSPEARFITGIAWNVDGGFTA
ncbi:oxidoreductase [Mycobacterium sp. 852002-53434_SCH5985345]|uniref:3-oxoacyl-ACP reductase family protein n=1 Tax=unclassified Mycobacterium TaxID=2642494 RepID=UPI0007FC4136|nr:MULTISPECIES: 3-oxoacyl-ACP reductase family protein [unclassified Mycobacterium]OBF49005.1 oxidoreductase [Mycobacterium sp. 852002-53434_SCH5985345]OBF77877.1 oxidoreductase [Mycobacterium sp. 852002-51613_SCH5001154]